MSILGQKVNVELPVNLRVLKRGGSDQYNNGKIKVETEKAILVHFEEQKVGCWIGKRNIYHNAADSKFANGVENYGVSAKMWQSWARVTVRPIDDVEEKAPF